MRGKRSRWLDRHLVRAAVIGVVLIAAPPVALGIFGADSPSGRSQGVPAQDAGSADVSSRIPGSSVSLDATGRLVVVARGPGGTVRRSRQSHPGGPLPGWSSMDAPVRDRPILSRNTRGGLTMFAIGPDGRMRRSAQGASNAATPPEWADMGGDHLVGTPAAAQDAKGNAFVAARGEDGELWVAHQADSGTWGGWEKLPGAPVRDDPAIGLDRGNRLRIFALSDGGGTRTEMQAKPAGTTWVSGHVPGEGAATSPAVAVDHRGRMVLFVVGADGTLRHNVEMKAPGSWRGWRSEGGRLKSRPIAASDAEGTVVALAVNADNGELLLIRQAGEQKLDWSSWFVLGGSISEPIAAVRDVNGRLVVFSVDTDGVMLHNIQSAPASTTWRGWVPVG